MIGLVPRQRQGNGRTERNVTEKKVGIDTVLEELTQYRELCWRIGKCTPEKQLGSHVVARIAGTCVEECGHDSRVPTVGRIRGARRFPNVPDDQVGGDTFDRCRVRKGCGRDANLEASVTVFLSGNSTGQPELAVLYLNRAFQRNVAGVTRCIP